MYKMLILDIDDTLTPPGANEVPPRNLAAIRRAQEAGIHVTLATGRGYLASSSIWRQIGIEGPVINYGGAIMMDTRTDQPIHTTAVPNELVQEILDMAAKQKLYAHIYQGDTVIYEKASAYTHAYTSKLSLPHRADPDIRRKVWLDVPKVLIITGEEEVGQMIPVLERQYAGKLKISRSSAGFIEFNHASASKGSTAALLAASLGIRPEEVAAVGDNSLDLEMVSWAGLGCAVGNARPELMAVADMVLPRCEDMAIEYLIDNVLLKG